jgi:hypothetical protein
VLGGLDPVAAPPSPTALTALPAQPRGVPELPFPGEWIAIGPGTRERMAAVLEQQLGVVWQALLEQAGASPGRPYRLVIEAAHLEPAAPAAVPAGMHPGVGPGSPVGDGRPAGPGEGR